MFLRVGFVLIMLAVTMGDSERLIVPIVLFAVGGVLLEIGRRKEARDEQDHTKAARS